PVGSPGLGVEAVSARWPVHVTIIGTEAAGRQGAGSLCVPAGGDRALSEVRGRSEAVAAPRLVELHTLAVQPPVAGVTGLRPHPFMDDRTVLDRVLVRLVAVGTPVHPLMCPDGPIRVGVPRAGMHGMPLRVAGAVVEPLALDLQRLDARRWEEVRR